MIKAGNDSSLDKNFLTMKKRKKQNHSGWQLNFWIYVKNVAKLLFASWSFVFFKSFIIVEYCLYFSSQLLFKMLVKFSVTQRSSYLFFIVVILNLSVCAEITCFLNVVWFFGMRNLSAVVIGVHSFPQKYLPPLHQKIPCSQMISPFELMPNTSSVIIYLCA